MKFKKVLLITLGIIFLLFLFFKLGAVYQKKRIQKENDEWVSLIRVIDGDTIEIQTEDGNKESVRLIGIDALEMDDKENKDLAIKSKTGLEDILKNQEIKLEKDESQSNRDVYGRLLRYVFLKDGSLVNKIMIEKGLAEEYTFIVPYKYQEEFKGIKK